MKIIVTGHQGTLGAPLFEALVDRGHAVYGIDKEHDDGAGIRADVGEFRQLDAALRHYEVSSDTTVYHLAAEFGRHNGEEYAEQLWRTNVVGTHNLLLCQRAMRYRLIFASSSEIYGEGPFDREMMDEEMPTRCPPRHHNDYAMSKWVNEQQIRNVVRRWGTESMILRFFNAYGPGEYYTPYRSVIALFVYRALSGLPYTIFEGYSRVFQYVGDFIRTLAGVVEKFQAGETINIGGSEYRPVADAHKIISAQLGLDPYRPHVQWEEKDGHNTVSKRPDITKALILLGHKPHTTLENGIAATIAWMREVYGFGDEQLEMAGWPKDLN